MKFRRYFWLFFLVLARNALGDTVFYDGLKYQDVKVKGYRNGGLVLTIAEKEKVFELGKVEWMDVAGVPGFLAAEKLRDSDAKGAAQLYKGVIRGIDDTELKKLAEARAIGPAEEDGKWLDAVGYFLDVYKGEEDEATWGIRPTKLPGEGSSLLGESAQKIQDALLGFEEEGAKRHLRTWEVEIYTKARDARAGRIAKELATGIVEGNDAASVSAPLPATVTEETRIEKVQGLIKGGDFAGAIRAADGMLEGASAEGAVKLYELKALALERQGKVAEAAGMLLRIVSFYPGSTGALTALWLAGNLQSRWGMRRRREVVWGDRREISGFAGGGEGEGGTVKSGCKNEGVCPL